jgi:hypothetical protein
MLVEEVVVVVIFWCIVLALVIGLQQQLAQGVFQEVGQMGCIPAAVVVVMVVWEYLAAVVAAVADPILP